MLYSGISQVVLVVKNSSPNAGDLGSVLSWEEPLEEDIATHSSVLAWRIPWTEKLSGLQSMGNKELDSTAAT